LQPHCCFLQAGVLTAYIACYHPPLAKPKQQEIKAHQEADHDSLTLWQKRVDVFRMAVPDIAVLFQFQALGHGFLVRCGTPEQNDFLDLICHAQAVFFERSHAGSEQTEPGK
jgi:hypothetical protein